MGSVSNLPSTRYFTLGGCAANYCILFQISLPGSDNDECKTLPFLSELVIADDSLLLVDENDIRELSSPEK